MWEKILVKGFPSDNSIVRWQAIFIVISITFWAGRWLSGKSTCLTCIRTWVWIPRAHVKLHMVACICNPRTPRALWKVEMRESWETQGHLAGGAQQRTSREHASNKVKGEEWYLRLSFDITYVLMQHTYTQGGGQIYIIFLVDASISR